MTRADLLRQIKITAIAFLAACFTALLLWFVVPPFINGGISMSVYTAMYQWLEGTP